MKRSLLVVQIFLISIAGYSQEDSLIGKWQRVNRTIKSEGSEVTLVRVSRSESIGVLMSFNTNGTYWLVTNDHHCNSNALLSSIKRDISQRWQGTWKRIDDKTIKTKYAACGGDHYQEFTIRHMRGDTIIAIVEQY